MNKPKPKPKRKAKLKVMYGINELAELSGMTRHQVVHLIEANGIPTVRYGERGKVWVMLSRIALTWPDLFESLTLMAAMHRERRREENGRRASMGESEDTPPPSLGSVWIADGRWRARVQDGPEGSRAAVSLGSYDSKEAAQAAIHDYIKTRAQKKATP